MISFSVPLLPLYKQVGQALLDGHDFVNLSFDPESHELQLVEPDCDLVLVRDFPVLRCDADNIPPVHFSSREASSFPLTFQDLFVLRSSLERDGNALREYIRSDRCSSADCDRLRPFLSDIDDLLDRLRDHLDRLGCMD